MRGVKDYCPIKCGHCGKTFHANRNSGRKYCSIDCTHKDREQKLEGRKFGLLTVIKRIGLEKGKGVVWLCKCDCGATVKRLTNNLKNGTNQSCGCFRRKAYGLVKTTFYSKYNSMHLRCENPQADSYSLYGGRGIKCRWKTFQDFYKDMYQSYIEHCEKYGKEKTTIDRIDSNGDYCKENCRWATPKEQSNNTRRNRLIKCGDETLTLTQRAEKIGVTVNSIHGKLSRGVPIEWIVNHPNKRWYKHYDVNKELAKYN